VDLGHARHQVGRGRRREELSQSRLAPSIPGAERAATGFDSVLHAVTISQLVSGPRRGIFAPMSGGKPRGIERIEERPVYANRFLTLFDDRVRFPSGVEGTYVRTVWRAPWSVAIVALTAQREYVLIRSFNYAAGTWHLQVPKGFAGDGRTPRAQAELELAEETGYAAGAWELVSEIHADPGFIANPTYVFRASGAAPAAPPRREATEVIDEIVLVPADRAQGLAWLDQVKDAVSRAALLDDLGRR
jgi:ADP-ribose pyrophosphatase